MKRDWMLREHVKGICDGFHLLEHFIKLNHKTNVFQSNQGLVQKLVRRIIKHKW